MDDIFKLIVVYGVIPGIVGIGAYLMRTFMQRVDELEKTVAKKVDEGQVRQLLIDKIEPLREDVLELKVKLDKIMEILINK